MLSMILNRRESLPTSMESVSPCPRRTNDDRPKQQRAGIFTFTDPFIHVFFPVCFRINREEIVELHLLVSGSARCPQSDSSPTPDSSTLSS